MPSLRERIGLEREELGRKQEERARISREQEAERLRVYENQQRESERRNEELARKAREHFNTVCLPILREVSTSIGVPMRTVKKGLLIKGIISDYVETKGEWWLSGKLLWDVKPEENHAVWKEFSLTAHSNGNIYYNCAHYDVNDPLQLAKLETDVVKNVASGNFQRGDNIDRSPVESGEAP